MVYIKEGSVYYDSTMAEKCTKGLKKSKLVLLDKFLRSVMRRAEHRGFHVPDSIFVVSLREDGVNFFSKDHKAWKHLETAGSLNHQIPVFVIGARRVRFVSMFFCNEPRSLLNGF